MPWKKGHAGRPRGSTNKTTRLLKEAMLLAAELSGMPEDEWVKVTVGYQKDACGGKVYDYAVRKQFKGRDGLLGYLKYLAQKHPQTFAGMLIKVLPIQLVQHEDRAPAMYRSADEISNAFTGKGLPTKVIDAIADRLFTSPAGFRLVERKKPNS